MKKKNVPHIFLKLFGALCHAYPNKFSLINFSVPRTSLKTTRFAISTTGLVFWNNCLSKNKEKKLITFTLFKQRAKEKIMELSAAANFFR